MVFATETAGKINQRADVAKKGGRRGETACTRGCGGDQLRQKENQTVQFSGNKVTEDFQMEEITVSNPINQVM